MYPLKDVGAAKIVSLIKYVLNFVLSDLRLGKIIEGQEKRHVKSKYIEDEYIQNHSSVWGSFWTNGHWGYR